VHNGLKVRGATITSWDRFDPGIYGLRPPATTASGSMSDLGQSAGPSLAERAGDKPWHPDSPLFWFGALLALTLGLIGAATTVRVGPFKAQLAAGKST
jgi:hypothetical protein